MSLKVGNKFCKVCAFYNATTHECDLKHNEYCGGEDFEVSTYRVVVNALDLAFWYYRFGNGHKKRIGIKDIYEFCRCEDDDFFKIENPKNFCKDFFREIKKGGEK